MVNIDKLNNLKEQIINDDLPLSEGNNLVFSRGDPSSDLFIIGEAPGEKENQEGLPFVGRAGKLLDEVLEGTGFGSDDYYIANILKYRPPDNRDPKKEEIRSHTPYLVEQIKIVDPVLIVTLGNYASKFLLSGCDSDGMSDIAGISSIHGDKKRVSIGDREFNVFPTFHPAATLYNRDLRPVFEDDFRKIKEELNQRDLSSF